LRKEWIEMCKSRGLKRFTFASSILNTQQMKLSDQTILITGGTSGFGRLFAERLLAMGNTVLITGRDQSKLDLTRQQLPGIHTFQSDVSDPAAITDLYARVTQQFPQLNILINNAGEMRKLLVQENYELQDVTREIEINLMGPVRMVQQFLPHLLKQPTAAILNVSSGIALIPFPISPIYGASKAGVRSYTQSLRVQLQHTQVRIFELVAPAANTPLGDTFMQVDGFDPKLMMDANKVIDVAIKALQKDKYEILPGMAKMLKLMSRLAPRLLFGQLRKVGAKEMRDGRFL
jgi:uncharacterized oxidoreductase